MKGFIEKVMALSTAHMPSTSPDFGSLRVVEHEFGYVVFIGDARADEPEWIGPVLEASRAQECTLLLFDQDCNEEEDFPSWDW